MSNVLDVIKRLLPGGTLPGHERRPEWRWAPIWPPDVFAVTATLVSLAGCYSRVAYTAHWSHACVFNAEYPQEVKTVGGAWGEGRFPRAVQRLWKVLIDAGSADVVADDHWCDAAVKLMGISDEASAGIGFINPPGKGVFADYFLEQYRRHVLKPSRAAHRRHPLNDLPSLPVSLCWMVPPAAACVQPKARTAQVGCTLRSLSHNLALLPPVGELTTKWLLGAPASESEEQALNLLLVPFPFRIDGGCFLGEPGRYGDGKGRFFSLDQRWLIRGRKGIADLTNFLVGLVAAARREVRTLHGLILPEAAIASRQIGVLARNVARRTDLEVFVSGVLDPSGSGSIAKNVVYTSIFHRHRILRAWAQSKHHRWKLDGDQVRRYHLGDALDPQDTWWEKIDVGDRACNFYVFRHGASLAALVCEDLARIDPVQYAVRAVGPNLVIVLLMDGPQLERRWPGRYATVLADDPGSAVLTLTSYGMVRRTHVPGEDATREIALWKGSTGAAQELKLPKGAHALLVTLSQTGEENFSLDGRSDRGNTIRLSLSGVRGIKGRKAAKWIVDR